MYKITVKAMGNPDHGQNPDKPLWGVEPCTLVKEELKELQNAVWDWQIDNCIGAGNWVDMPVYHENHCIGLMSYNGKVWLQDK
jgi:hypothetical protein